MKHSTIPKYQYFVLVEVLLYYNITVQTQGMEMHDAA